jgi:hypothetical protein
MSQRPTPPVEASRRLALRSVLAGVVATAALPARALYSSLTPQGVPFVTGGISLGELSELRARRKDFSLWIVTAARSGAHLADARIVIRDSQGETAFNRRLDGPWLFIDLPLGSYEIEATFRGETQQRKSTIHAGDRHQLIFRFDTGDQVSPDNPSPGSATRIDDENDKP